MLDNRIKPKIFVPFIERGFIFVQYSQICGSHFADRRFFVFKLLPTL